MASQRRYSEGYKARMVARMGAPGGPTATGLAAECGVSQQTLSRWLREAGTVGEMSKRKRRDRGSPVPTGLPERDQRSTRDWSPEEKLRVIVGAAQLKDEELGAFLRREGIHAAQVEGWRAEMLAAVAAPAPRSKSEAKLRREFEREIARKDKALAEVTALLVLEKKLGALFSKWEEEGDSTTKNDDET